MFQHFSLRGMRASIAAIVAMLADAGKPAPPPIPTPEGIASKRRVGMSAKSPWSRYRNNRCRLAWIKNQLRNMRLTPASGPGSYLEEPPQQRLNRLRQERLAKELMQ